MVLEGFSGVVRNFRNVSKEFQGFFFSFRRVPYAFSEDSMEFKGFNDVYSGVLRYFKVSGDLKDISYAMFLKPHETLCHVPKISWKAPFENPWNYTR